jgi:hypothetical protein
MRGFLAALRCARILRRAVALSLTLIALLALPAISAEPRPNPQRFIPARELVAHVEYDGLAAHAGAWEATAAYGMLARTPAGAMMTEVASQVVDRMLKMAPGGKLTGADLVALEDHLVHHGFAISAHRHRDDVYSWTVVLNRLGRKGPRERFDRLIEFEAADTPPAQRPKPARIRGRDINQAVHRAEPAAAAVLAYGPPAAKPDPPAPPMPWLSWWFETDDLIVTWVSFNTSELGQQPASSKQLAEIQVSHLAAVLDALEGKQPNVTTHPAYAAAMAEGSDIKGFESNGLFFIDPGKAGGLFSGLFETPGPIRIPELLPSTVPGLIDSALPGRLSAYAVPKEPGVPGVVGSPPISPSLYGPPGSSFPTPVQTPPAPAPAIEAVPDAVPPVPPSAGSPPIGPSPYGTPAGSSALTAPAPAPAAPPSAATAPTPAPAVEAVPGAQRVTPSPSFPAVNPFVMPPIGVMPPLEVPEAARPVGLAAQPPPEEGGQAGVAKKTFDPAAILGLDGVKRIVGRWGFQGKALLTDVRIEAPVPRKGLLALLDQPGFDKDNLPPIPRSTGSFAIDSLDLAAAYGRVIDLAKSVEPEAGILIDQFERAAREATGLRLREDLLSHIGPTWCVLAVPSADEAGGGNGPFDPADYALVVSLRDADGFQKVLGTLASRANQYLRDREKPNGPNNPENPKPDPPMLALDRLPAPDRGYRLTSPSRLVYWLSDDVQPTILVGESYAAIAINPERARQALAIGPGGGTRWRPTGELARSFECLPAKLTFLTVGDHRDSAVPEAIAGLPGLVQLLSATLGDFGNPNAGMPGDLLTLAGVPGAGGFRLRIDPDNIPKAQELQAHLFPSVFAASVDGAGLRFIAREAFPFACAGQGTYLKSSVKWSGAKGLKPDLKLGWKWRIAG